MIPTIPGYHGDDPTDARLAVFPMMGCLMLALLLLSLRVCVSLGLGAVTNPFLAPYLFPFTAPAPARTGEGRSCQERKVALSSCVILVRAHPIVEGEGLQWVPAGPARGTCRSATHGFSARLRSGGRDGFAQPLASELRKAQRRCAGFPAWRDAGRGLRVVAQVAIAVSSIPGHLSSSVPCALLPCFTSLLAALRAHSERVIGAYTDGAVRAPLLGLFLPPLFTWPPIPSRVACQ